MKKASSSQVWCTCLEKFGLSQQKPMSAVVLLSEISREEFTSYHVKKLVLDSLTLIVELKGSLNTSNTKTFHSIVLLASSIYLPSSQKIFLRYVLLKHQNASSSYLLILPNVTS